MDGVDGVAAALRRGVSVEVVGRPASGRTEFLDRTATLLEARGMRVLRLHGIGGWRDRPFGTLAASLPELSRQPSIWEAVNLLVHEVTGHDATSQGSGSHGAGSHGPGSHWPGSQGPGSQGPGSQGGATPGSPASAVLVLDDADDVDDVSAGVLAALRIRNPLPVLFARRVGPRTSPPLRRLFASLPPVVRHTLRPLRYAELAAVVEAELDGPVDEATMARIATKSGGLPGVARDLVRVGKQTRRLTLLGSQWIASERLWTSELGSCVDALLVDATPDDVDALTTLALAGPVRVADLHRLVPLDRAERLGALGLIDVVVGPADAGTVGLYPPLLEEYLARESATSKRYAVRELLTTQGLPVPPGLISDRRRKLPADNAILSRNLAAHWAATIDRLAGAWRAHPTAANGVALLTALLSAHRTDVDPAAVYAGTEPTDDVAAGAELAGWYAVHLALAGQDPQEAWHVLDEAAVRYPDFELYLRSVRRHLELMTDRAPEAPERPAADAPPLVRDSATAVRLEGAIAQGRTGAALAELERARPVVPRYVAHAEVSRAMAQVIHGEVDTGVAGALASLESAQREYAPGVIQAHGYAAALGMAIRGDLTRLDELVSYILTITSTSTLHSPYHAGIAGLDAARVRWLGLPGAGVGCEATCSSSSLVLPAANDGYGPFPFIDLVADSAAGVTAQDLWSRARSAASRGFCAAAVFAMVEAAELGPDAGAFAAITTLLDDVDSPLLAALVDLADAMVRRDADHLLRAQGALEGFGAWLYVARAGIMRSLVLREQGENVQATEHANRLWAQVTAAATGAEDLFGRLAQAVELSAREIEVAGLAVDGWASGEIAGELVLSVRTVENHIFNTYRKLGVESRTGLRQAFTTWLRPGLDLRADAAR